MVARVAVFVDYENVSKIARIAFGVGGHTDPLALGHLLARRGRVPRRLTGVHVYCGMPAATRDALRHHARSSQGAAWERSPLVRVTTRPLKYRPDGSSVEKGIDVALAVDLVLRAVRGAYDVAVLVSTDSDLLPALEAVVGLRAARVEVAAWSAGRARRLALPGERLWCHWLDRAAYDAVEDPVRYARPR